ncbi:hypothetical protein K7I13_06450 [Brucepastera parasyntrophica]|uniref:hypothetical protein n=1 Tax=Brucepastera parasyntrophica TaxID=2880008 RepID=UPI00210B1998|nr:hypothetical protein [Brucepastera parasyntrophica]ULQ60896.1 hypothetical protein K7I13_06450 [Brucepastera parasyntrophica]
MNKSDKIIGMLIAGGVYPDIPGKNMRDVFQAAADIINLPRALTDRSFLPDYMREKN